MMDWRSSINCIAPFSENEHGGYERVETQTVAIGYGKTLKEAQTNARLISAVLELLEAAHAAEAVLGRQKWIEGSTDPEAVALFKLRDAIAKATGEAA